MAIICAICHEEADVARCSRSEPLKQFCECESWLHASCLKTWMETPAKPETCPVCREDILKVYRPSWLLIAFVNLCGLELTLGLAMAVLGLTVLVCGEENAVENAMTFWIFIVLTVLHAILLEVLIPHLFHTRNAWNEMSVPFTLYISCLHLRLAIPTSWYFSWPFWILGIVGGLVVWQVISRFIGVCFFERPRLYARRSTHRRCCCRGEFGVLFSLIHWRRLNNGGRTQEPTDARQGSGLA